MLTTTEYKLVTSTPYELQPFPDPLVIAHGTDLVEAVRRIDVHLEKIHQFQ